MSKETVYFLIQNPATNDLLVFPQADGLVSLPACELSLCSHFEQAAATRISKDTGIMLFPSPANLHTSSTASTHFVGGEACTENPSPLIGQWMSAQDVQKHLSTPLPDNVRIYLKKIAALSLVN